MKNWYIVQSHSSFENKVANLIKEAPQELTGECNVWKNYADFPVGKL